MSSDRRPGLLDNSSFAAAWHSGNEQVVNAYLRAQCRQRHDRRTPTSSMPQVELTAPGVWKLRMTVCSVDADGRDERRGA
jgi:hypothetical protein